MDPEPSRMFLQITEICKQSKENILLLLFQDSSSSYVKDQHLWWRLFVVENSSRLLLTGGKTVALLEIPAWATPIPLLSRIIVTQWQLRDNVWQCGSRRTCHSSSCRTCHTVVLEGGQEARLSSPWHHFSMEHKLQAASFNVSWFQTVKEALTWWARLQGNFPAWST